MPLAHRGLRLTWPDLTRALRDGPICPLERDALSRTRSSYILAINFMGLDLRRVAIMSYPIGLGR
jgi:hypothetical protein